MKSVILTTTKRLTAELNGTAQDWLQLLQGDGAFFAVGNEVLSRATVLGIYPVVEGEDSTYAVHMATGEAVPLAPEGEMDAQRLAQLLNSSGFVEIAGGVFQSRYVTSAGPA